MMTSAAMTRPLVASPGTLLLLIARTRRTTATQRRFASAIYGTFAVAALLLAAVGLYGVMSGHVAERTREIAIRTALRATRIQVVRSVLASGLLLTMLGIVIGVLAASVMSRLLESLLYGISRADLATYLGVIVLLGSVSALACWLPARRAATVDPAITLRSE